MAARKIDHRAHTARPQLRVVRGGSRAPRARSSSDSGKQVFALVCVCVFGLALFGVGRVMLASRATEASIRSGELREQIKAERLVGDLLEVDKSALTVPSRIENIAGTSMRMGDAVSVEYMALADDELPHARQAEGVPDDPVEVAPSVGEAPTVAGTGMLASLMELAAGEAQVLLVGDVGLASSE